MSAPQNSQPQNELAVPQLLGYTTARFWVLFAIVLLVLVSRKPGSFLPTVLCRGRNRFLSRSINIPASFGRSSCRMPDMSMRTRLTAFLASFFPALAAPWVFAITGVLVQTFSYCFVYRPECRYFVESDVLRAAAAIVMAIVLNSDEMLGNIFQAQWHLVLVGISSVPSSRGGPEQGSSDTSQYSDLFNRPHSRSDDAVLRMANVSFIRPRGHNRAHLHDHAQPASASIRSVSTPRLRFGKGGNAEAYTACGYRPGSVLDVYGLPGERGWQRPSRGCKSCWKPRIVLSGGLNRRAGYSMVCATEHGPGSENTVDRRLYNGGICGCTAGITTHFRVVSILYRRPSRGAALFRHFSIHPHFPEC